jgi:hypothetical protein
MAVYELSFGRVKHFVSAESEQDAYLQGTDPEQFPDINYLPFEIREVIVPGHTITVTPNEQETTKNKGGRPRKVEP